jgi:hypothetical protein
MATNNSTNTSNPITVAQGGTGLATLTAHSVQVGNGTGTITQIAVGATNSVMIGSTGADPSFSTTSTTYFTGISFDSGTNTLSTYTKGTFVPTITGSTSNPTPTYVAQYGFYTKVGKMTWVEAEIQVSALTGGTGALLISALPFTSTTQTLLFGYALAGIYNNGTTYSTGTWFVQSNSTTAAVIITAGTGFTALPATVTKFVAMGGVYDAAT